MQINHETLPNGKVKYTLTLEIEVNPEYHRRHERIVERLIDSVYYAVQMVFKRLTDDFERGSSTMSRSAYKEDLDDRKALR